MDPLISQSVSGENAKTAESKGHFLLMAKVKEDDYVEAAKLYQLLTPSKGRRFVIFRLTHDDKLFKAALDSLEYYLVNLPNNNRRSNIEHIWEYQIYHCSTAANLYANIAWRHVPFVGPILADANASSEVEFDTHSIDNPNTQSEIEAETTFTNNEAMAKALNRAKKTSIGIKLFQKFNTELQIVTILILAQLLVNQYHWLVDLTIVLGLAYCTRLAFQKINYTRKDANSYRRIYWLLFSAILSISTFVAMMGLLYQL